MNCGHFHIVRQDAPLWYPLWAIFVPSRARPFLNHSFGVRASPDESQFNGNLLKPPPNDNPALSLFTAIQEQLGLKLEPTKGPVGTIVIDHIERPSAN
jgi:hypothetical protein